MNRITTTIIAIIVLLAFSIPGEAKGNCSIRTLRNVCEICEERAVSKEVSCPQASLACIQADSFHPFLKANYTLSGMLGEEEAIFKLNITRDLEFPIRFNYEVRYQNFRTALQNGRGFLIYDIVNFNLPVVVDQNLYSYNCIGVIDNTSNINGVCSTLAPGTGIDDLELYSWGFTALPNTSPLQ